MPDPIDGRSGQSRRRFLAAAGTATTVGLLGAGSAVASHDEEYDTYQYHGHALAPGAEELVTQGDWAYVASGGLTTVDLSDPTAPTTAGRAAGDHRGETADVDVDGDLAALTHNSGDGGVSFFDVSDPAAPTYLTFYDAASSVHNLFLEDGYAYLTITDSFEYSRMVIVDATDVLGGEPPETMEGPPSAQDSNDIEDDERGTGGAWMLRDVQKDMAEAGVNPLHDIYVQDGLAYLCYWEAGVVVVDVTDKRDPCAVAHFGAVDYVDEQEPNTVEDYRRYVAEGGNAHYVQPTPDGNYTFVGAETFPGPAVPPGGDAVQPNGEHGGIRVFDTRDVDVIEGGKGSPIYPKNSTDQDPVGQPLPKDWTHVAFIPAPDPPDDVLGTSHNFDVTAGKLFSSFYQAGVRAYDITPTLAGQHHDPKELAAFDVDGTAFWTAENLAAAQGETYFTVASDSGKGAVVLELTREQ